MQVIINYLKGYFYETNKQVLILVSIFTATLVVSNYYFGINEFIQNKSSLAVKLILWYAVFGVAFALPHLVLHIYRKGKMTISPVFLFLILLAPAIFSVKNSLTISFIISPDKNWDHYWNHILYWPLLLVIVTALLLLIWRIFDKEEPFYGLTKKNFKLKPYLLMLIIMIPFIAAASTQTDFLITYPKLKAIAEVANEKKIDWWHQLLFELSYGSDFFTTELFFRGFLILAFIKWAGRDTILPMAAFYCTIHFGKPLGECISSYFGGILLGVIVYNTRSIWGGLIVHLGIAWLMEVGGYIGNMIK